MLCQRSRIQQCRFRLCELFKVYPFEVSVFVFAGNPNFVGLVAGAAVVLSNVYVVLHGLVVSGLPLFLQSNLEVYSFWHDFIGVFAVGSVIGSGSSVEFSFLDQFSNAGGSFDQVDGPVLVDVASVVTVVEFGTFFFNNWFAYNVVNRINFFEVNGYLSLIHI